MWSSRTGAAASSCQAMEWGLRLGDQCWGARAGWPQPGSGVAQAQGWMGQTSAPMTVLAPQCPWWGAMVWHPTASLGQGLVALGWAETGLGSVTDLLQRAGPLLPALWLPVSHSVSRPLANTFQCLGALPTEAIKLNLSRDNHYEWMSCTSTSPFVTACKWLHNTHSCRIVPGKPFLYPH